MMRQSLPDRPRPARGARLGGIVAAVPTPFDESLAPCPELLGHLCHRLVQQGCHGILILGTTGEANSLSLAERLELLEHLAGSDLVGSTRLLVGTGCCALPDTIRLTRAALEIGAAGVLVLPPFYYKPPAVTDEGLFASYSTLIEAVGDERLRLYLYRFPKMTGLSMGKELIVRLHAAYPGVVRGLKDSSGSWEEMAAVLEAIAGFEVFPGSEQLLLPALRAGGPGCISATASILTAEAVALYDGWQGPGAELLQQRLSELRRIIQDRPLIPAIKAILAGWTGEPRWAAVRPPLSPLDPLLSRELIARLRADGIVAPRGPHPLA